MPYMPARLQCLMTMERFVDYLTAVVSHTTCLDQQNLSEGEKSSNLTSVKKLLYIRIKSGAQLDDQLTPNRERAARATRNRKRAIRASGREGCDGRWRRARNSRSCRDDTALLPNRISRRAHRSRGAKRDYVSPSLRDHSHLEQVECVLFMCASCLFTCVVSCPLSISFPLHLTIQSAEYS